MSVANALADVDWQELDPRHVKLERTEGGIFFGCLGVISVLGGIPLFGVLALPYSLAVPLGWILLGGLAYFSIAMWPRWEHRAWSYYVDDKIVRVRFGVIWQKSIQIPISRLQHIDLHRGPLERKWELATLELHTAGTINASQKIPGLAVETAEALRASLTQAIDRGEGGHAFT